MPKIECGANGNDHGHPFASAYGEEYGSGNALADTIRDDPDGPESLLRESLLNRLPTAPRRLIEEMAAQSLTGASDFERLWEIAEAEGSGHDIPMILGLLEGLVQGCGVRESQEMIDRYTGEYRRGGEVAEHWNQVSWGILPA